MEKHTMGLLISHKNNEKCRAILPEQVADKPNVPSMSLALSARAVELAIEVVVNEKTR